MRISQKYIHALVEEAGILHITSRDPGISYKDGVISVNVRTKEISKGEPHPVNMNDGLINLLTLLKREGLIAAVPLVPDDISENLGSKKLIKKTRFGTKDSAIVELHAPSGLGPLEIKIHCNERKKWLHRTLMQKTSAPQRE